MSILAHNSFPRESINPHIPDATVQVQTDHRFRGYPNGMMESPRIPATNPMKRILQPDLMPGVKSSHYPSPRRAPGPPDEERRAASSENRRESFLPPPPPPPPGPKTREERDFMHKIGSVHAPQQPSPREQEKSELMRQLDQREQQRQAQQLQQNSPESRFTKDQLDQILTKRYDLHQLQTYDPWGKPGNGAPTGNHYKQKFLEEDIKPDMNDSNVGGLTFHKPGGGAPLRTSSGRLKAELQGDVDIRYQTGNRGRELTEAFRYKKDRDTIKKYREDLESIQRERAANEERQRLNDMRADLQSLQSDIYGRPGGGAPNRLTNYGSMNSTRPKQTTLGIGPHIGHGAPLQNQFGESVTKLNTTMDRRDGGMSVLDNVPGKPRTQFEDHNSNIFHPFGTPGGGNPNYDKDGNRIAIIPGPSTVHRDVEEEKKKALAAQELNRDLQRGMVEQELKRKQQMQTIRSPTEGIADRMFYAQGGKPRRDPNTGQLVGQHLGSTDVTELSNISPRLGVPQTVNYGDPVSYHTDLDRQVQERRLRNLLQKQQDVQEARLHDDSFYKSLGHNAPDLHALKKQNFIRNLYHPDDVKNEYRKSVLHNVPVANTNYVKNNTRSSHVTAYELANGSADPGYMIRPPYAPHFNIQ